ncbi:MULTISPECIES: ScbA/BarX family gamma-butyrolactone biosynthesis protein [Streptomyces]|uniref:ScbA/BarX family gamma-butyrolactone biosynthesis protein n=1 Tax=Streptomyces TaxID=1883 RepID=UPI0015EF1722|nr:MULTISPECIES: ScbA/BarX family gamma-butyrolactone biosynthesis protein [Streptomyces]KAF5996078.1 gamma-butyrolactone biosynthesis enzyme [Streptomyces sp. WAC00263]MCX4422877.1 ScbA/BarX family gamma-butyrolactone biosynthesis protein [Streptomyces mirabilis]
MSYTTSTRVSVEDDVATVGTSASRTTTRPAARSAVQPALQTSAQASVQVSAQASVQTAARTLTPRLTTTVPREYVHRAAVSEVLLTGWEAAAEPAGPDPDEFAVSAQWPRSHSFFTQSGGYQDPMLLIESVRQIGSLLAHAEFGVPFGHQFLMWDMFFSTSPELLVADAVPTEVELRTVCRDIVRRGRVLGGMRYDVTVLRDGRALATAGAAFSCTSPAVHRRLRAGRPTTSDRVVPPAIDPAAVGHSDDRHVLLAEPGSACGSGDRWELRVDTAHPTFFDHPVDHIPGMVLLEAARQAALVSTGMPDALLLGLKSNFARYAEFDAPCWIEPQAEPHGTEGGVLVRVRGTQHAETVFTAELVLSPRGR